MRIRTFMVPPYLAYYAAMTNNQTLMTEAYNQCAQYRKARLLPFRLLPL